MRVLCLLLLLQPALASTGSPRKLDVDAPKAAQQRYEIALIAYREGRYAEAAREFDVAATIAPKSAKLAYNAARSWERAGDSEKAIARYRSYLALSPQAKDRATVEATVAALEAQIGPKPAVLVVNSEPVGAEVYLDGATASKAVTPARIEVPAGSHTLRVELDGHAPSGRSVEVAAGEALSLGFTLSARRAPAPPWVRPAGWAAVGLGIAAAGVSGWLGFEALSTRDEADSLRGEASYHDELSEDFEAQRLGAFLSGGSALVLGGLGLTFLLMADDAPGVTLGPNTVGFAW